ncbi:hypothetical protein ACNKHU_25595 [Shigella flexneri]
MENGIYLHGLPYAIPPDSRRRVPMLLWLSEVVENGIRLTRTACEKQAQTRTLFTAQFILHAIGINWRSSRSIARAADVCCKLAGE